MGLIRRTHPIPAVDPDWVRQCLEALQDAGLSTTPQDVLTQYLHSDLGISTLPGAQPVLPADPGAAHGSRLFPRPVLLQVLSLTEIGSSAFQLQTVLEQRRDVLDGKTRIRRMDDDGDGAGAGGGEVDMAELGKLPAYPRGMLKLELSDGRGVIKAIEYGRLGALKLGETSLGAKVVLCNVPVRRGTLLLSGENTQVLGCAVDHLEAEQPAQFVHSLQIRMGKVAPSLEADAEVDGSPPPPPRQAHQARRGSSPARREVAGAGPSRAKRKAEPATPPQVAPPKQHQQRTASKAASAKVSRLYAEIPPGLERDGPSRPRAARQDPVVIADDDDDDEYGDDADESFFRAVDLDAAAAASATAGRGRQAPSSEYDFGLEGEDDSVLFRTMDEVEASFARRGRNTSRVDAGRRIVVDVDSGSEDEGSGAENKENIRPDVIEILSD